MQKVFVKEASMENVELTLFSDNQIGINVTDECGTKSSWVSFPLEKAKDIKGLLDGYIKEAEKS